MRIIYLVGDFNHLEKNISQWEMGRIIPYIMGKNVPNHQPVYGTLLVNQHITGKWPI
jgi:hypothetical protein